MLGPKETDAGDRKSEVGRGESRCQCAQLDSVFGVKPLSSCVE